jgi:hypothetical protein
MIRMSDRISGSCFRLSALSVLAVSFALVSSAGGQSLSSRAAPDQAPSDQAPSAQYPVTLASHSTVAIFSDNPLSAGQWMLLFAELRSGLARGGAEFQSLDRDAVFLREDQAASLDLAGPAVSVYLHGNCTLEPQEHRTSLGRPLGWVHRVNGRIEPFIHIDCTQIGHVLGAKERWLPRQGRDRAMALAISRVFFHEWIHISTQSAHHTTDGIAKAAFDIPDLIRPDPMRPDPKRDDSAASPNGSGR